jgi:hypothetical protein
MVITNDLAGYVAEHERAESETLIMKTAALRKQVKAVHFERSQETDGYASRQQENSNDSNPSSPICVIRVACICFHVCSFNMTAYAPPNGGVQLRRGHWRDVSANLDV